MVAQPVFVTGADPLAEAHNFRVGPETFFMVSPFMLMVYEIWL